MRILHCLFYSACVFGGTLLVAGFLLLIKPIVQAILMPIGMYWNWVGDRFESELVQVIVAIAPVCGLVFAIVFFVACMMGD